MNHQRDVHTYAFVNHPYERVCAVFHADPKGLLQRATRRAVQRGQALIATMHAELGPVVVDEEVAIELTSVTDNPPGQLAPCTRLSLTWRATHGLDLFPMDATLDLMSLGPLESQLDFLGKYRPRLGVVGAAVDAVIGHRIMEASVHKFVEDIADRLREEAK